ncbi:DUF1302 domain-containing protein [Sinimarinibacterium sp. NLF-5-8]|uniref:DUF1302 domain-containing protein n=1 Tax=Sinimarinibacterium sp. NLF-5-8 TaxID=2698684 RepID=UPI00137BE5DA|nr:DUF1302 domain-containing protein [Sinimarinibacterium sp. NLF-5-8]QHS09941.1 DUF1302 domain-containing protein [Sinimarinibacterium sp. NLF-5-8]
MKKTLMALAVAALGSGSSAAWAVSTQIGGLDVQLDNKLSVGAAWRLNSRDMSNVGIGNGGTAYSTNSDDGNLAFDKGDLVAAAAKITSDLTLSKGAFGVFVRGTYVYDNTLKRHDFFNPNNYYTPGAVDVGVGITDSGRPSEAPMSAFDARTKEVRDYAGSKADLLDAYFYGSFAAGTRNVAFKIGQQVLNWGESTFVLHGINSLLTYDQNKQRVPGFEIEELLLPTSMVWVSTDITRGVSVEAFYQLGWDRTEIDAAGTFWAVNDFATIGGNRANITFGLLPENFPNTSIPRAANNKPKKDGQFGGRLNFLLPVMGEMDVSLYAMNYHSRLPVISGTSKTSFAAPSTTGSYFLEYPEDIQLYGVSFNTAISGWSIQGEYSYKAHQPLQIDDVEVLLAGVGLPSQITPSMGEALGNQYIRGWRRHDVSQMDLGFTYALGPSQWFKWDQLLLLGEWGGVYVHDLPSQSELRYEGPGTFAPGDAGVAALVSASTMASLGEAGRVPQQIGGYATAASWGYKLVARAQYNNVLGMFRVEPMLKFDHDVNGTTPTPITNFVQGRRQITAAVATHYLQSWSVEVGYAHYFGAGAFNILRDRDFASLVAKYAF